MRRLKMLAAAASLLVATSCGYLSARLEDLDDCILVEASYGLGLDLDARLGPLELAFGTRSTATAIGKPTWWAWHDGFDVDTWAIPGTWIASVFSGDGKPAIHVHSLEKHGFYNRVAMFGWTRFEDYDKNLTAAERVVDDFGIEGGLFLGVVGLRAGVNVAEVLDFVTGWFGWDLWHVPSVDRTLPPVSGDR